MMNILFKKTNVHNHQTVYSMVVLVNSWFQKYLKDKRNLPGDFDTILFKRGIDMLLNSDHNLIIYKALWLLYQNYPLFNSTW